MATENKEIEAIRKEIDKLDDKMISLLVKRAELVKKVGEIKGKSKSKNSIIRPGREANMVRRISEKTTGPLPAAATAFMWRLIISSAINIEENPKISALALPDNRECYWLAREYFGGFTPIEQRPTVMEVLQDVIKGSATVGVVYISDATSPQSWWSRITETAGYPKIFAKLPFVQLAPSEKPPLVAIGYVEPEETGDDESLWVIKADEMISINTLEGYFKELKVPFTIKESCRVLGVATTRHYLVEVHGFTGEGDKRMEKFVNMANENYTRAAVPVSAHYLGAYATPITFS